MAFGFRSLPTNNQDKQEGEPSEKRKRWNLEHCGQDKVDFLLSLAFGFVIIESIRGVHSLVWSVLERYFAPHL